MNKSQVKIGAILNYLQLGLAAIVSIVVTPFLLMYLGDSEYGILSLSTSIVSYLNLIVLGITGAFMKFNIRYRVDGDVEGEQKLNATFLVIYIVMAIIMLIAGMVLVFASQFMFANSMTESEIANLQIVMAITVLSMAISLPFSIFTMNINAYEKFIFAKIILIIVNVFGNLLKLFIVVLGGFSIAVTVGVAAVTVGSSIARWIYCKKVLKIKFKFGKVNKPLVKSLFAVSIFIFFNQITDMINWNVDVFILGVVGGTAMVAVYSLASVFKSAVMSFSTAITAVKTPQVHKLVAKSDDGKDMRAVNKLFQSTGRIQFIIMAFIISAFIFFGKDFIVNFYAGVEYIETYYIAVLLIAPLLVPLIQNIGIEIQVALNKHKFRSIVYLCIAVANVGITIPLSMLYGGIGAAIGTCLSLIIGNGIIMNIYYHKKIGLNIFAFWREILKFIPSLILPIVVGICIMLFAPLDTILMFLLFAVIYTIVYGLSMLLLGMNKSEKQMIFNPIFKIIKKVTKQNAAMDYAIQENKKMVVKDNVVNVENKFTCSGCSACYNICPKNAIEMQEDDEGFKYPVIDEVKCINCGKCISVCQYSQSYEKKNVFSVYACYNKNIEERMKSSSGGIFIALAKVTIKKGGIVFGASFDTNFNLSHTYAETIEECSKFMGSKYLQSDCSVAYSQVKEFLLQEKEVLFSGTPCQVEGLKLFLGKEYEKLLLVDLICHGAPSPKVYRKYVKELEDRFGTLTEYSFRDKTYGWQNYYLKATCEKKDYSEVACKSNYMHLFLKDRILRKSCYNCVSKGIERSADITLADFWGINNIEKAKHLNDDKGVSFVVTRTEKADIMLKNIENLECVEVDLQDGIRGNRAMIKSCALPPERDLVFHDLDSLSIDELAKKHCKEKKSLKRFTKRCISKCLRILKLR